MHAENVAELVRHALHKRGQCGRDDGVRAEAVHDKQVAQLAQLPAPLAGQHARDVGGEGGGVRVRVHEHERSAAALGGEVLVHSLGESVGGAGLAGGVRAQLLAESVVGVDFVR